MATLRCFSILLFIISMDVLYIHILSVHVQLYKFVHILHALNVNLLCACSLHCMCKTEFNSVN